MGSREMETRRHREHRAKNLRSLSVTSVPLCFKNFSKATAEAEQLDAAIRKNLEVLGYGE
ncbi:MAG: hypothetical protein KatS3mg105_5248 [Gemmatales bacterium]|nr:MAG: hypothetical protein KatS3mg105_5248 [Gemmatales bacterium]GIW97204.1 MAG: hypothetical protein KatS3mg111_0537 [Pirellulaceae bacterium]